MRDRDPETWDCTGKSWGDNTEVVKVIDDGARLRLVGWHRQARRFREGDYLLIRNGRDTTRYRLTEVSTYLDPPDMWKGWAEFAPRESRRRTSA